jgi:cytochrome c peroxidase
MIAIRKVVLLSLVGAALIADESNGNPPNTGMADPDALMSAFDKYVAGLPAAARTHLVMSLVALRGLTSESMNAGGTVTVDLTAGTVSSSVNGLPADGAFDLWLIQNRPASGHTTMAEPHDILVRVGSYQAQTCPTPQPTMLCVSVSLGTNTFAKFLPDRAFVVRSNQSPLNAFVLTGSSTIFDRLMHRQVRLGNDSSTDPAGEPGFDPMEQVKRAANFALLIAEGRRVFVKEQFDGNGRACGTCHVESHNFTIDPDLIATLPRTDPLFVAETNHDLAVNFEKPDMMRKFGLFLENVDGFGEDLADKFTLRAAQNVQALVNSSVRPDPGLNLGMDFSSNGLNPNPPERLGWGNDGAPLREFAAVAIVQHATKTLYRRPGIDFRVPTDEELDALAAYQLALGRQEDFNLKALVLTSSIATKGETLYLDTGNIGEAGHKNCNSCHFNGGGTAAFTFNPNVAGFPRLDGTPLGFNIGSPTNVNDIPLALALSLPRDGGFGVLPLPNGGFGNFRVVGNARIPFEEFNTPPVVESADTGPFFHNHTVKDLESAVAFYGTDAFQKGLFSIGNPANKAIPINISSDPNDPEVQAIAAFLRVLNALENIRSSINVAERGRTMASEADAHDLARLAYAETADAIKVLSEGALVKNIEPGILSARVNVIAAGVLLQVARYTPRLAIDNVLQQATSRLRAARSDLAVPSTLPTSYRN